jgi:hypothetical protein
MGGKATATMDTDTAATTDTDMAADTELTHQAYIHIRHLDYIAFIYSVPEQEALGYPESHSNIPIMIRMPGGPRERGYMICCLPRRYMPPEEVVYAKV